MSHTIDRLTRADTVLVISIRIDIATVDILQELSALPCQRGGTDGERITYTIIRDSHSIVGGQEIAPGGITVGINICRLRIGRSYVSTGIQVRGSGQDVAIVIVGIQIRTNFSRIILPDQLAQAVVYISRLKIIAADNFDDVSVVCASIITCLY